MKEEFRKMLLDLSEEFKDKQIKLDLKMYADDLDFNDINKIYYKFCGYVECLYSRRIIDSTYHVFECIQIEKIHEFFNK